MKATAVLITGAVAALTACGGTTAAHHATPQPTPVTATTAPVTACQRAELLGTDIATSAVQAGGSHHPSQATITGWNRKLAALVKDPATSVLNGLAATGIELQFGMPARHVN